MPTKTAKKTVAKAKKAPMKKVGAKRANKTPRLTWNQLTPQQQALIKRNHSLALAKARKEIAAGGRTLLKTTKDGWRIYASNSPLILEITQADIDQAVCGSKEECVVAQSIKRQVAFASGWRVGSNITIVYCEQTKEIIRYGTSSELMKAIPKFDKPPYVWNLKPGFYRLTPLPAAYRVGTRWAWYKGSGGKASKFKGPKEPATRSGTYCEVKRGRKKAA